MKQSRSVLLLLVVCLVGLVLGCAAGGAGVRWGVLDPPQFDYSIGPFRVIADIAIIPLCSQLINPGCVLDHPVPPARIYTIWFLWRRDPFRWDGALMRQIAAFHLEPRRLP